MTEPVDPIVSDLVQGHKRNGRCVYSCAGKRALIEAALRPGVSVARIAMTHGVNANLLRKWIRAHEAAVASSLPESEKPTALLPVKMAPTASIPSTASSLEIVVGDATIRLRGTIDAEQLRTVIDCLTARR
jgi:transposase